MPAVCRREVCKYAQQSKNRALKLSRLDLAGLHRSQTVGMAHFSKPSSLEYACYRQTAKKKYFSRHLLVLATLPARGPPSLGVVAAGCCTLPPLGRAHICAATHQTQTFPPSFREGTSVLLNVICCRISLTADDEGNDDGR